MACAGARSKASVCASFMSSSIPAVRRSPARVGQKLLARRTLPPPGSFLCLCENDRGEAIAPKLACGFDGKRQGAVVNVASMESRPRGAALWENCAQRGGPKGSNRRREANLRAGRRKPRHASTGATEGGKRSGVAPTLELGQLDRLVGMHEGHQNRIVEHCLTRIPKWNLCWRHMADSAQ
jgi:hypothetical protein